MKHSFIFFTKLHFWVACDQILLGFSKTLQKSENKDVVKLLLNHCDRIELNARDNNKRTAFILACQNGHKDVAKLLLEHFNSNLNTRSNDRFIAFIFKLFPDHRIPKIKLNARDKTGRTTREWAFLKGHEDIVNLILEHSTQMWPQLRTLPNFSNIFTHYYITPNLHLFRTICKQYQTSNRPFANQVKVP